MLPPRVTRGLAIDWIRSRLLHVDQRYQKAAWTSLIILVGRMLQIVTTLVTIPLLSRYLGGELLGLWLLVTNFVGFLMFADLGVGVGFQNQLIRCFAANNKQDPSAWVANALLIMLAMGTAIVALAFLVVPLIPFDRLFALASPEARYWIVPSTIALAVSFAIGLPAMLIEYIGNAYQRGYWAHGLTAIGRVISLVGVCVGCYLQASIVTLIILFVATSHIINLLGSAILWWKVPWLRPDIRSFSIVRIRQLLHVGFGMLGVRLTHALSTQGPVLLTANLHGLTEAAVVAVVQKMLAIPSMATQPVLIAMQGAIGEAAHKGQWNWVHRNLTRLTHITCVVFGVATLLAVALGGNALVLLLDTDAAPPSRLLLLLLCVYTGMITVRTGFGVLLTAVDRVFYQSLYRFVALLITFLFVYQLHLSTVGIMLSFVMISETMQLLCMAGETGLVIRRGKLQMALQTTQLTAE